MEQDPQTILDAVEQLRLEMKTEMRTVKHDLLTEMQTQLSTVKHDLLTEMQTQLNTVEHRVVTEMRTNFQAVRAQLNSVERGVVTIAQKLLADAEVAELKTEMRKAGGMRGV